MTHPPLKGSNKTWLRLAKNVGWFEDYYGGRYCKVSGTYTTAADQTPTVTGAGTSSGYIFTTGDVVRNMRTGECMVVGTVAATTVQLHVRAFGTTAAAAGVDGDELFIIGNVNEENSGARNVNTTRSAKLTNYTLSNDLGVVKFG